MNFCSTPLMSSRSLSNTGPFLSRIIPVLAQLEPPHFAQAVLGYLSSETVLFLQSLHSKNFLVAVIRLIR